jgi:hypothetical protein
MSEIEIKEKKPEEKKTEEKKPEPKDNLVETKHAILLDGQEIKYSVTAGTIVLKEETVDREKESEGEKPKAAFFFVAYTKDGVKDKSTRPITFSFNGGPGSSSVWLHLGVLGPRRVVMGDAGLHRSGQHRVFPSGGGTESSRIPRLQEGHRNRRRFHPSVYHPIWSLVLPQVPGWGKLRHDEVSRSLRIPAGASWVVPERDHVDIRCPGFQHPGV